MNEPEDYLAMPGTYQPPSTRAGAGNDARPPFDVRPALRHARANPGTWVVVTNPLKNRKSAQVRASETRRDKIAPNAHLPMSPWHGMVVTYDEVPGYGWAVLACLPPAGEETTAPAEEAAEQPATAGSTEEVSTDAPTANPSELA